jgi:purine-binding chemotaxis protein CheW
MSDQPQAKRTKTLAKPDVALADYLDTLLAEIDGGVVETATVSTTKAEIVRADTLNKTEAVLPTAPAATVESRVKETASEPEVPAWAEAPFQVLTFTLGKVKLAVPLSCLNGILNMDQPLTQLPGQPDWSMGVMVNHDNKVVVVDTQKVLMPEQMSEAVAPASLKHLLLIGEGTRGLAVESLQGTEMMDKTAVRWRGLKGDQHPWYAGIVVEKLTIMLDVDGLMEVLAARP